MERTTENRMIKRLLGLASTLAVSLAAMLVVVLAGRASASPLTPNGDASGVPLSPPTVPATIPVTSPTAISSTTPHSTTPTPQGTSVPTSTYPPGTTPTPTIPGPQPTGQPTSPVCTLPFSDVHTTDWFYGPVQWMYCNGVISGYPDNTFRPNRATTRGQMAKIAIGAFALPIHTDGGPHFTDVPSNSSFYGFVETAYYYSVVSGYPCGGPGEPCDSQNRPYFRPNGHVTRGQLTKMIVLAAVQDNPSVWQLLNPPSASFVDVATSSPFYQYVETAVAHGLLQGYPCGSPGEPCPGRYFRPGSDATRAQLSKIVYTAVTQQ